MDGGLDRETVRRAGYWLDWGARARDRLLASRRFRRWAAAFPPTRSVARRQARALFDLCAGFVYSQVLFACVQLGLFPILVERAQTAAELAARVSIPAEAAERLLAAAVSLRLVERRGRNRYGLGALGAVLAGSPAIIAMIQHHALLYADLENPVALLRGQADTALSRYWTYTDGDRPAALAADRAAAYTALMAASQPLITDEILHAYPLGKHRCLMDVGGGDGTFLAAVAARNPSLKLVLMDLPAVAEIAKSRFAAASLSDRVACVGGDFLAEDLPAGADLVSLVRVLHDHNDDAALGILRAVHRCLPAGGAVLVAEPMSGTPGAEPIGDAYFGFYLLAMGRGRPRTSAAIETLLRTAGFVDVRQFPTQTPLLARVIVASREDVH